jgi:hypothetical protein
MSLQAAKWAAACARFTFWDLIAMSYPPWEPVHSSHYLPHGESTNGGAVHEKVPHLHSPDTAIDAALCSVPLPDGLLSRLDKFVRAMTDETTDSVDWLGC